VTFLDKIGTRPVVTGIVSVTPEFFSDGGRFVAVEAALAHERLAMHRCDIIDVAPESTRPRVAPVADAEELARIAPVPRPRPASVVGLPLGTDHG
jgi:dihydropteroate synthase